MTLPKTRSKFETKILMKLEDAKIEYQYEPFSIAYQSTVVKGCCLKCESTEVVQRRSYTPDVVLSNNIVVEIKGYLKQTDRSLLRDVKRSNPHLDLRLVLMADKKYSKDGRYSDWCKKYGFPYAIGEVPPEWSTEGDKPKYK